MSADARTEQSDFVRDQFVELFLKQNKRLLAGLLLCGIFIFSLLTFRVPGHLPYAWLAGLVVILGMRFFLTEQFVQSGTQAPTRISGLLLLNGVWLMLPVLAFENFTDVDRALITVVMMATATGSVATTSGYKNLFLWFAIPMLLPLGTAWGLGSPTRGSQLVEIAMGGLILAYLLFLAAIARDAYRLFDESCRIRFAERTLNFRLSFALEETRQASKAKTRFLAAASHDLRQPLHTLSVLLAAIGLRKLDERSREIVQMLGNVSQSLSGQLDGLLDISRLDAGVVKPDLQTLRIDQIVEMHAAAIEPLAKERGLYVKVHCDQPVQALTDLNLFQRLLGNLTSNALKFTNHGGIDLFVGQQDGLVTLDIVDTGIGIAAEHRALIFQEFYQVGNVERDRTKGLGLGLAIVHRLSALLAIKLDVESRPDQGSKFTLQLPMAEKPRRETPSAISPIDAALPNLTVLVVDDETDVLRGMYFLLEELGCRAVLAESVTQACRQARTHDIDMLISDFRLRNEESGLEVVRLVRELRPEVYALLISGDTAPDRLKLALAAGIPLLHKPVALYELLRHIHKAKPQI